MHEGARSLIYRGNSRADDARVVVKTLREGHGVERVRALQHEWELLSSFANATGIITARALERDEGRWGLVMTDADGVSLQRLALAGSLSLDEFFELALGITSALERVHRRNIVHRDIHPGNIVVSPDRKRIAIVDFASATRWTRALPAVGGAGAYLGVLSYVSPEQTGRMNRAVDSRSDLYSLGVLFFELLVGSVPFNHAEPLEIVHAHVARRAPDPSEVSPGLPRAVCQIVSRLLAKNAEDRYQSAFGLRADLELCRSETLAGRTEFTFAPGTVDEPEYFRLPERLYGRQDEIARLSAAFDRASTGTGVLASVAGPAGIGKSSLVRDILPAILSRRGFFGGGKFEQYEGGAPYAAFAEALEALARQLLGQSAERLASLRTSIEARAPGGGLASVLTELCPAFELVLGRQPPAAPMPANDARIRLHHAIVGLLAAVTEHKEPICLFLDDVQWAKSDSIELLKQLAFGLRDCPVLLIVAYRTEDEATSARIGSIVREASGDTGALVEISLGPLNVEDSTALVRGAINASDESVAALGAAAFARTAGNPFFLREFLAAVYGDNLVRRGESGWVIDIQGIRQRGVTDNVVALLTTRVAGLPAATQEALRYAACLGNRFDVATLSRLVGRDANTDLWSAVRAELVLPLEQAPRSEQLVPGDSTIVFRFTHDRVQQAIMASVEAPLRRQLHLRTGLTLLRADAAAKPSGSLFDAVTHLNSAGDTALTALGGVELATLNQSAAAESLRQAAGAEALTFARAGLEHLGAKAWTEQYALTRDLHLLAVEAAFVVSDYEVFTILAAQTLKEVRAPLDVAKVRALQSMVHFARFVFVDAIGTCLGALAELGVIIPSAPTAAEVREELRQTADALRHKTIEDLLSLPVCSDPSQRMAMDLLSRVILATAAGLNDLFPVVTSRLVRMSVECGNIPESVHGYIFYGQLMCQARDIERAYRFGTLALDMAHRFEDTAILSHAYLYATYQLMHWKHPFRELVPSLEKAREFGLRAASPFNAACSATTLCIARFWAGDDLTTFLPDARRDKEIVVRFRQGLVQNWHDVWLQVMTNLRHEPASPTVLGGPDYDEAVRVSIHREANDPSALFNYYVGKATLACHLGEFEVALECLDANAPLMTMFPTQLWAIPVVFVDSFVRVVVARRSDGDRREALLVQVRDNLEKLKGWLSFNRVSLEHKIAVLEAELAAIGGDRERVGALFFEAVRLARAADVAPEEGLICERAARWALAMDGAAAAREPLRAAHRAYLTWGATTKVKALEREFPNLVPRAIHGSLSLSAFSRDQHGYDSLDLVSALNASRLISSEIRYSRMVPQLMSLLIESAGAQFGYLIVERAGEWVVECGQSLEHGDATMLEAIPLAVAAESGIRLATSIVNYVARTGETVLLDDASVSTRFVQDAHVQAGGVYSVLSFALKRSGGVIAVAYLENNLVRGAFTASSVQLLEMLSTQAVISLENAILYADLEKKVERRTRELSERNQEITAALTNVTRMQQRLVAQEKLAALGALTAGIAHEIKNPLNFVTNFAAVSLGFASDLSTLTADRDSDVRVEIQPVLSELTRALEKIREHGARASAIVTEMASHARASGGPRELTDLNAEVARCITEACESSRCEPLPRPTVIADYGADVGMVEVVVQDIHRVFVNIVTNALDAMERKRRQGESSFRPELRVRTATRDGCIEIRIRDNGIGISATSLEQVFQPFFTTKSPGEGTGLGLSICHDIVVRAHGGELSIESNEGEFSEFIVTLPRHAPLAG